MRIDPNALKVYTVGQPTVQPKLASPQPAKIDNFAQSRFADRLTQAERKFISENFEPSKPQKIDNSHLGRFLDVLA
jgi:hypothetical protein